MIVLPTAHAPAINPDELGLRGVRPKAPLCMRCGEEATQDNPVMVTKRSTWSPFDPVFKQMRHIDAICAKCREILASR